jgi:glucokinase
LSENPQSGQILRELVEGNIEKITAKDVFTAARLGDSYSQSLVKQTTDYLGILMANMASLLNMEKIVIGGGISRVGEQIITPIRHIVEHLSPYPPEIEISTLQADATILGAISGVLGLRESSIQFSQLHWDGY